MKRTKRSIINTGFFKFDIFTYNINYIKARFNLFYF